jgi:uncharacterized membrane protein
MAGSAALGAALGPDRHMGRSTRKSAVRQLMLWVPTEYGDEVRARASEAGATHTLRLPTETDDGPAELQIVHMANARFNDVLTAVEHVEGLQMVFQRDSVVVLEPPKADLPDQVTDVSMRGPLEILVEGLQSLGGWTAFLSFSVVAGVVVWMGLVSNTIFLLTAAMLIAPYAAPAMTTALATARGDGHLLRRSVGRYLASVGTTAVTAAVLTLIAGETEVTHLMVDVADVSATSLLLPLGAGVAGALSFGRADRTGIASGAGIGMLVALALAPQAGLMGIALVLGEARIIASSAFLAALQLLGINLAATVVFLLLGVRRRIPRADDGRRSVRYVSLAVTALATFVMIGLQVGMYPELSRKTVTTRVEGEAMALLDDHPDVHPVDALARFPLEDGLPNDLVVLEARVVVSSGASAPDGPALAALVRQRLINELPDIDPRVGVSVVEGE